MDIKDQQPTPLPANKEPDPLTKTPETALSTPDKEKPKVITKGRVIAVAIIGGLMLLGSGGVAAKKISSQDPIVKLNGEAKDTEIVVPLYDEVDILAEVPNGVVFGWAAAKQPGMTFKFGKNDPQGFFFAQKPGVYNIGISWLSNSGIKYLWVKVTVPDSGNGDVKPKPQPPVPFSPNPPPLPVPPPFVPQPTPPTPQPPVAQGTKSMMILVVDNPGASSSWTADYAIAQPLNKRISDFKHEWEVVDRFGNDSKGQPVPAMAKYVKDAAQFKLPMVFVIERETQVTRWWGPLPKDPSTLLKKIEEVGG